jgi:transposase
MEDWVTIKTLKAKNPKISNREVARLLQVSPHTVKNALERQEPPSYTRPTKVNHQLDPFREVIFEMVNIKKFKGSRILSELRSKGYTGGKTAFYHLLSTIKIESQKTYTPYETLPGEQAQFDWSPYTVLIANHLTKIIVFSYVNSFSRYQIFEVSLAEDQGSVFEALENSLVASGGVPQRLQTDNAKVFVHNASRSNFQWNKRYLHLCGHYGFQPSRSLPAHPWSKGKVEKPFSFLENHFIAGASFDNLPDLVAKLKVFQTTVNTRLHATIKTTPEELLGTDRQAFSPLPETRYVGVNEETRKVTADCLLSYGGSRYSVPWMFATKHVWVRVSKGYFLEIYSSSNVLIATHPLSMKKGAVIIERSHYRTAASTAMSIDRLRIAFKEQFPGFESFLERLQAQKRFNHRYHLFHILQLAQLYNKEDFQKALRLSLEYNVFTVHFLSGFLEQHCRQSIELTTPVHVQRPLVDETQSTPVTRHLSEYRLTIEH